MEGFLVIIENWNIRGSIKFSFNKNLFYKERTRFPYPKLNVFDMTLLSSYLEIMRVLEVFGPI